MGQHVRDVMTPSPVVVQSDSPLSEAAKLMRDHDIGSVVVVENDDVSGIVTDRDLVVRGLAEASDPASEPVGRVASHDVAKVAPDQDVDEVLQMMREKALRRVPVVEGGRPVGIVSLGDLAKDRDPDSVLGEISAAPPNN